MRKVALLVGVKSYKHKFNPVPYAIQDATALGDALKKRCKFDEIRILAGSTKAERPTVDNILANLEDLAYKLNQEDLFLFHFSGHGVEIDDKGYLLAYETRPNSIEFTGLKLPALAKKLNKLDAKQQILLIDACSNSPETARGISDNRMADALARDIRAAAQPRAGTEATTALLSACQSGERAFELDEEKHGVFTYYLLQGINGTELWEDDKLVFERLAEYTQQKVTLWSEKKTPQHPWFERFGGAQEIFLAGQQGDYPIDPKFAEIKKLEKEIDLLENGTHEILQPMESVLAKAESILKITQEACTAMERLIPDDQKKMLQTIVEQDQQVDDVLKLTKEPFKPYVYQLLTVKQANNVCDSAQNNYEKKKREEITKIEKQLEPLKIEVFAEQNRRLEGELETFFDSETKDIAPFPESVWNVSEHELAKKCPYLAEIGQITPKAKEYHDEECWKRACGQGKSESYQRYIEAVPKGRHISEAWRIMYLRDMKNGDLRKNYLRNVTSPLTGKDVTLALRSRNICGAITGVLLGIPVGYILYCILHIFLLGDDDKPWSKYRPSDVMTGDTFEPRKLLGAAIGAIVGGIVFAMVARYMGRRRGAFKWPNGFLLGAYPGIVLLLITGVICGALKPHHLGERDPHSTFCVFCSAIPAGLLGGIAGAILFSVPSGIIWWVFTRLGKGKAYNDLAKLSTEATRRIGIGQVAKDIGVEVHAILEKCKAEGFVDIKDPKSTVPANFAETIREWFRAKDDQQKTNEQSVSSPEEKT